MRTRICDSQEEEAFEILCNLLREHGAEIGTPEQLLGVDVYRLQLGDQKLILYSDAWTIELDGPKQVVEEILTQFRERND